MYRFIINNKIHKFYKNGIEKNIDIFSKSPNYKYLTLEMGNWHFETGLAQNTTQYNYFDYLCRGLDKIDVSNKTQINVSLTNTDRLYWGFRCYDSSDKVTGGIFAENLSSSKIITTVELPENTSYIKPIFTINNGSNTRSVVVYSDIKNAILTIDDIQYKMKSTDVTSIELECSDEINVGSSSEIIINLLPKYTLYNEFVFEYDENLCSLENVSTYKYLITSKDKGNINLKCSLVSNNNVNCSKTLISNKYGNIITNTNVFNINEGDSSLISVILSEQPTTDETVIISINNPDLLKTNVSELLFTSPNWNVAQTFSVTSIPNSISKDVESYIYLKSDSVPSTSIKFNIKNVSEEIITANEYITDNLAVNFNLQNSLVDSVNNSLSITSVNNKGSIKDNGFSGDAFIVPDVSNEITSNNYTIDYAIIGINYWTESGYCVDNKYSPVDFRVNNNNVRLKIAYNNSNSGYTEVVRSFYIGDFYDVYSLIFMTFVFTQDNFKLFYNGKEVINVNSNEFDDFVSWNTCWLKGIKPTFSYCVNNRSFDVVLKSVRYYNSALALNEHIQNYNYEKKTLIAQDVIIDYNSDKICNESQFLYNVKTIPLQSKVNESFTSNNTNIINGNLKAIANGETSISANISSTNNISTELPIKVVSNDFGTIKETRVNAPTEVVFTNFPDSIKVGELYPIHAMLLPWSILEDDNLVKITSSDETICSCSYGVVYGIKTGSVTITASNLDGTISTSKTLNIISSSIPYNVTSNVYNVSFPCIIDGEELNITNNSVNNVAVINKLLKYASNNNYKKIVFPKKHYYVKPDVNDNYDDEILKNSPVLIPLIYDDLIIDFSDSIIEVEPTIRSYCTFDDKAVNNSRKGYVLFCFTKQVKNSWLINAHIKGEANTIDRSLRPSWWGILIQAGDSYNCGVYNSEIYDSLSWGVAVQGYNYSSIDNTYNRTTWLCEEYVQNYIQKGLDDNGNEVDGNGWISPYMSITDGNDNNTGYCINLSFYWYLSSRLYHIYWYDENKQLIEVHKNRRMHYVFYNRPVNAKYCRVYFFLQPNTNRPTGDTNWTGSKGTPIPIYNDCSISHTFTLENCELHGNRTFGVGRTTGDRFICKNNKFYDNGGYEPSCDIDCEDGWAGMTRDIYEGNEFNSPGGVIVCAGKDAVFINNKFNTSLSIWKYSESFRVINNDFYNGSCCFSCQYDSVVVNNYVSSINENPPSNTHYGKIDGHENSVYNVRYYNNNINTIAVDKNNNSRILCKKIDVNKTSITFTDDTDVQITPIVYPINCNEQIKYYTDKPNVAIVNSNGIITPIKNGSCSIYVVCGYQMQIIRITVNGGDGFDNSKIKLTTHDGNRILDNNNNRLCK